MENLGAEKMSGSLLDVTKYAVELDISMVFSFFFLLNWEKMAILKELY